eukprot:06334_4
MSFNISHERILKKCIRRLLRVFLGGISSEMNLSHASDYIFKSVDVILIILGKKYEWEEKEKKTSFTLDIKPFVKNYVTITFSKIETSS